LVDTFTVYATRNKVVAKPCIQHDKGSAPKRQAAGHAALSSRTILQPSSPLPAPQRKTNLI
jgi:hypothetical protein